MSRPEPNWGQSRRTLGPAKTGRHSRAGRGQRPGCLDVIVLGAGSLSALGYEISRVIA
jgi:hypothetical protein